MPVQPRDEKDPEQDSRGKRLESWKEIAGYLNRHVTTIRATSEEEQSRASLLTGGSSR